MSFGDKLKNCFQKYNIEIDESQVKSFKTYFDMLIEYNSKVNLTSITSEDDVIIKHFLDSVLPLRNIPNNSKIIDIGTGAGFPSIPLMIMNNTLRFTLIDSVNKKLDFVRNVIEKINLGNAEVLHSRIEDLGRAANFIEKYDFVVARAVSKLNTLLEYSVPFLKIGGRLIAYKSVDLEEELDLSSNAFKLLRCECEKIDDYQIENNSRKIVFVKKISKTSNVYPRTKNLPRTNPL